MQKKKFLCITLTAEKLSIKITNVQGDLLQLAIVKEISTKMMICSQIEEHSAYIVLLLFMFCVHHVKNPLEKIVKLMIGTKCFFCHKVDASGNVCGCIIWSISISSDSNTEELCV